MMVPWAVLPLKSPRSQEWPSARARYVIKRQRVLALQAMLIDYPSGDGGKRALFLLCRRCELVEGILCVASELRYQDPRRLGHDAAPFSVV